MKLIEKRQTEIDELYFETFGQAVASPLNANTNFATEKRLTDEEILSKAKGSKNAFLFAGLWEGQWQEIYPSQSEADSALCMILAFWTMKNAEQIDRIFRQSGLYRDKWDEMHGEQTYGELTISKAMNSQTVIYDPEYQLAKSLTDRGNSLRFARIFKGKLLYCSNLKSWLKCSEGRWERDESNQVMKMADVCIQSIYGEAAKAETPEERKAIVAHGRKTEALVRIKAMVEGATFRMPVNVNELDQNPFLFNVLNGTIDLRTGGLRQHNPNDLITKMAPVVYDPDATCPRFKTFLAEIFPDELRLGIGNTEVVGFVQKFLGYSLTGDCREQVMGIAWGTGANGKSTLFSVFQEMLGDYATTTPSETLLCKKNEGIPNDVARLRGARFVLASETPEGRKMNVGLIKQMTGQDLLTARFLHCEFFAFMPTFKLLMLTNHKPEASGEDDAIWRRIRLIPFLEKFDGATKDDMLGEKLRQEWPGILRWCVEGCLRWQKEGLKPPMEVVKATTEYRSENDIFSEWLNERGCVESNAKTSTGKLFRDFTEWMAENGERRLFSQKKFGQTLKAKGFDLFTDGHGVRSVKGIMLKDKTSQDFDEESEQQKSTAL